MKRVLILVLIILSSSFAQNKKQFSVPEEVKAAFVSYYSEAADVKWSKNVLGYKVNFKLDNISASLILDSHGKLLKTETSFPQTELPGSVFEHISSKYKNYKIAEVSKIVDAEGTVTYDVQISKGKLKKNLFFKVDGTLISKN